MTRYFVHLWADGELVSDEQGVEASLTIVIRECIAAAAEYVAQAATTGEILDGYEYRICDRAGQLVYCCPFETTMVHGLRARAAIH